MFVPSPGGEPLWRVSRLPRTIRLNAGPAEKYDNRRLPETFQRDAFTQLSIRLRPSHRVATRWVVRGSRLLSHCVARQLISTNIAGRQVTGQSGSPPGRWDNTRRQRPKTFRRQLVRCSFRFMLKVCLARHAPQKAAKAEGRGRFCLRKDLVEKRPHRCP